MLQQTLSRTFRGERGKPVVKSGAGNAFAHPLFTHLIGPSEEKERRKKKEWKEERRRGFHHKQCIWHVSTTDHMTLIATMSRMLYALEEELESVDDS